MKVALVHDYLIDYGGAERVLKSLHEMYPEAPIYVSVLNKQGLGNFWKEFEDVDIKVSWFGKLPYSHRLISPFRFLLPWIWGSFNFSQYDLVITSAAWAVTKGVKKGEKTTEICYVHTPPRWLYGYDESRSWGKKWYGWIVKAYASFVGHFLRMYDFNQAQKVDHFIANSENVAGRIEKFYRREADEVIYPPVDIDRYRKQDSRIKKEDFYLTGGRLVNAKNFDLVIKAFNELEHTLKIYGSGPLREELEELAGNNIEFLGRVEDKELVKLYQKAKAFIVAQKDEDFGITPVEAMAAGTPVIAYRGGGYEESVVEGKTGVFFDELNAKSIKQSVEDFNSINEKISTKALYNQSKKFTEKNFRQKMLNFVSHHA